MTNNIETMTSFVQLDDTDTEELFKKATSFLRLHLNDFNSEEILYFYSRYKQAVEGPCNISKPNFFDFKGKHKWEAWYALGDLSKTNAMLEYITKLTSIKPSWTNEMANEKEPIGLGISVSTLKRDDLYLEEENKTVFDYVKEGNIEKVQLLLQFENINKLDENGMGLIHWATDRGCYEMLKFLLAQNAEIDLTDSENQTALHYAASCGHAEIIKLLIENNVNKSIKDLDGNSAFDIAEDSHIKHLISY